MSKLEAAGYVKVVKEFVGRKPHTVLVLTDKGRAASDECRKNMKRSFDELLA